MSVKIPSQDSFFASLEKIDFCRLLDKDPTEQLKLLELSTKDGFFYLDLQGPRIKKILADKDAVMQMMEWYFALPDAEKVKDNRGTHTHGYKAPGLFTGFKKGSRDCYETLKVSELWYMYDYNSGILNVSFAGRFAEMMVDSELLPTAVKERSELFESFVGLSHFVNKTLLASLSDIIGLQGSARFEEYHRDDKPSNTTLVLLHYPQQNLDDGMGHNKHTDIGSITLLFTKQWGLQLQQPGSKEWSFVAPRDGHSIINIGDSLRFLSGKRFNSCLHRVVPVAADENRYSIAYFLRPENAAHLEDTEGRRVKAEEWHDQKYVMFGESHEKQEMSNMLTGGMERKLVKA